MFGLFLNGGHNKRELVETYKLEFSFFFKMEFVFRMKRPVMSHMEDYPRCGPTVFVFIRSTSFFFFFEKKLSLLRFVDLFEDIQKKFGQGEPEKIKKKCFFVFMFTSSTVRRPSSNRKTGRNIQMSLWKRMTSAAGFLVSPFPIDCLRTVHEANTLPYSFYWRILLRRLATKIFCVDS